MRINAILLRCIEMEQPRQANGQQPAEAKTISLTAGTQLELEVVFKGNNRRLVGHSDCSVRHDDEVVVVVVAELPQCLAYMGKLFLWASKFFLPAFQVPTLLPTLFDVAWVQLSNL
jgi:hypothetical protein